MTAHFSDSLQTLVYKAAVTLDATAKPSDSLHALTYKIAKVRDASSSPFDSLQASMYKIARSYDATSKFSDTTHDLTYKMAHALSTDCKFTESLHDLWLCYASHVTPPVPPNPFPFDGLVAFWKLADTSDSSGNGYTLTNNNDVLFVPGKIGDAAEFNEQNWLAVSNETAFALPGDFGISFFVNLYNAEGDHQFVQGVADFDTPEGQWFIAKMESGLRFGTHWAVHPAINSNFLFGSNTWYHIAITRNGTIISIYVNGNLINQVSDDYQWPALGFCIGKNDGSNLDPFSGMIDACGFWNRTLSESEIAILYNNGNGLEP